MRKTLANPSFLLTTTQAERYAKRVCMEEASSLVDMKQVQIRKKRIHDMVLIVWSKILSNSLGEWNFEWNFPFSRLL